MPDAPSTATTAIEYRACIEYEPDGPLDALPWRATIYADGVRVDRLYGDTSARVRERAEEWATAQRTRDAHPFNVEPHWVSL